MELHQIRYFLAVCETLNFTRAAENCNVSQPSLTRAIQKLEDELGGQLFRRERNLSHLTELGKLIQPTLRKVYDGTEEARERARGFSRLEKAPLNLGVMCTVGPNRLVSLFSRLHSEFPGVDLILDEAVPEELVEGLMEGRLEAVLIGMPDDLPDRCDRRPLYSERYVVGFPPGHRFEALNAVSMRDLDQENYLSRTNCEYARFIGDRLAEKDVSLRVRYSSPREDWIQCMIMAGLGVSFLPEYLPAVPGLPTRVVVDPEVTRHIELVTVAGRRHSPALQAFLGLVAQHEWS